MLKDGNTLYNNVHELSEISSILRVADGNTELDDKNDINTFTTTRLMDRFAQDYISKVEINVKNKLVCSFRIITKIRLISILREKEILF